MLTVNNLYKNYKNTEAVKNVNFTIDEGEISILLGPNGAGKSTIIKSISNLIPYNGDIKIDGLPNNSIEAKRIFSYIGEIPYPFDFLTVSEHLDFMVKAYDVTVTKEEKEHYLDIFDMIENKDKLGVELSKGMKQKLSIICGIIVKPKYLLFDEPLIGLDPKAIRECRNLFLELKNKGSGILISTHIIESLHDLWDKAIIINKGETVLQDTKEEFEKEYPNESLADVFFRLTEKGSES